jgi:ATP/ADP translocase
LSTRLENLLLIREGERDNVVYFLVFFLLVSAGMAVGRGTADALFLKRLGIEYLPVMYMVQSLLLAAVSLTYAAYADRIPAEKFFRLLFIILGTTVFGCWLLISTTASSLIYPVYYMVYEVASEVLLVHATLYMSQNMHTLQAKRLSPLFFAGAQAGTVLGGLLLVFGAPRLGAQNLLLVWCSLLLLGLGVITLRHRLHGASVYFRAKQKGRDSLHDSLEQVRQGVRFTYKSSLLRGASFALFFMVISFYVVCYSVNRVYSQTFHSEEELTRFFGMLSATTSSIALFSQLFITNRVITRFGIRSINLLFPVTTIISLSALISSFTLPAALIGSINKDALMPAFRNPVRNMFFNVLPDYIQGRARALSIALVLPLALMLCGGLLVFMQRMDYPLYFLLPGLVAALLYLLSCMQMNKAYVSTLLETLKERLFLPDRKMYADLNGCSDEVFEEVMRGVSHPDPEVSLAFSRVLISSFPERAAGIILARAAESDNAAADRFLSLLRDLDISPYKAELQELARRGDDHLRASLLRLRLDKNDAGALAEALQQLGSDNPRLRATAIHASLLDEDTATRRKRCLAGWHALLQEGTESQLAALDIIPDLQQLETAEREPLEVSYTETFNKLLNSSSESVTQRTLLGLQAWQGELPDVVRQALATALQSRQAGLREAAAACLHLVPPAEREPLALQALGDGNKRVRKAVIAALHLATRDYPELALNWIAADRGSLRAQQELLRSVLHTRLPRAVFEDIARNKSHAAKKLQAALEVLKRDTGTSADTAYPILRYTLQEQLEQTIELALLAMEPLYEPGLIRIIRAGFTSGDARHIANACEALENLPGQETVAGLAEILQQATGHAISGGSSIFSQLDEVLAWCMDHTNEWLSLCGNRAMQALQTGSSRA